MHSTFHFHYLYRSSRGFGGEAWVHVELVYQNFNLIFSWFALVCSHHHLLSWAELTYGFFYLISGYKKRRIIISPLSSYPKRWKILRSVSLGFATSTLFSITVMLVYSWCASFFRLLGNRPQGSKWGYTLAMIGFALITLYMTLCICCYFGLAIFFLLLIALSAHIFFTFLYIGFSVFTCYLRHSESRFFGVAQCWFSFYEPYFQKYRDFACCYTWVVSNHFNYIREFLFSSFLRKKRRNGY